MRLSEHEEFMREQERAEERAYLRAGLTPPQPRPAALVLADMRKRNSATFTAAEVAAVRQVMPGADDWTITRHLQQRAALVERAGRAISRSAS